MAIEESIEDEPRYTVYKGSPPTMTFPNRDGELLDAGSYFVLRETDALAAPLLWLYLHELRTWLDIARQKPGLLSQDGVTELELRERRAERIVLEWQRRGVGRLPE